MRTLRYFLSLFLALKLAIPSAMSVMVPAAQAERVTAGLSTELFEITSNYVGGTLIVFGTIERDGTTIARAGSYDVAVVVRGPREDVVTRRKGRVGGIWVNQASAVFEAAPIYFATLASRPIEELAQAAVLERYGIGSNFADFKAKNPYDRGEGFKEAMIRLKKEEALFVDDGTAVNFLSDNLFMANVPLPATVPVGDFTVELFVFNDGALVGQDELAFAVAKQGFEQFMYDLAHDQPFFYGIGAVFLAIFTGWAAGVIFRRD